MSNSTKLLLVRKAQSAIQRWMSVAELATLLNVTPAYVVRRLLRRAIFRPILVVGGRRYILRTKALAYHRKRRRIARDALRELGQFSGEAAGRRMLLDGTLLSEDEFRARLGVGEKQLRALLESGSIFGMEFDGHVYYPAVLADPRHNRIRLGEVCRIIVPMGDARLDFLESRRTSLGDRNALEMLEGDANYARLLWVAEACAAEFSRTIVRLFEGKHETEPSNAEPLYTCAAEIDPRKAIWERASAALHRHGYQWPLGPFPEAKNFTAFVAHENVGDAAPCADACVQIFASDVLIRVRIIYREGAAERSQVSIGESRSVVDIAKRVVDYVCRR
ncbi:hypothetical protein V4C53_10340 [Paraburkholderia azotifigens]|uniref:hypothetical protein n=1 Tax=Paraburkholderia azotifigens TaxID=2057004 RepID=UPI003181D8D1